MFLKELELVGFKSFPERTSLKFQPGITAIVGPNGCGKSNVFDGIRWVLGEQSTKALRSLKMEDVIFNGTNDKASVGMAEVRLIFCNKARKLALDSDEIEVCRRVFRSGESQYLLNKAPVRLKDVLDLFMGTGIGAESYSLVEQGKIGLILSTRPEDRRLIFDEASGITKYKAQKREALRKLEETEQNLLRLNDIIIEVRREINSLERQANKARRYKDVFEQLKNKEITLANVEVIGLREQKQNLVSKIESSQGKVNSCQAQIQEIEKEMSSRTNRIQQLEKEISCLHDRLINIDNLINNNVGRNQINQDRITELNYRIVNLNNQLKQTEARIEVARKNLENFQKEYGELKVSLQEAEALLSERQKQYETSESCIKSSQEKMQQTRSQILNLESEASHIRNEIADLQAQFKSQTLRKKRLDIENVRAKEEKQNLEEIFSRQVDELNSLQAQLHQIKAEFDKDSKQQRLEVSAQGSLIQDIQNLENDRIALESQKEFLQELKLKYEEIGQCLNAVLFLDKLPSEDISGIVMRVNTAPALIEKQPGGIADNLNYKLLGEAKPMPFETQTIERKISQIQAQIVNKQEEQKIIELRVQQLNQNLETLAEKIKAQEMLISNRSLQKENIVEQLNKINQEYEVINIEIQDLDNQIQQLHNKQTQLEGKLSLSQEQQNSKNGQISSLESSITDFSVQREESLVQITQIKTEIENQKVRLGQEEKTQAFLENAYQESQQLHQRYLNEIQESESKIKQLSDEIQRLNEQNLQAQEDKKQLAQSQDKQQVESKELNVLQEMDNRKLLLFKQDIEGFRQQIYEYQMQTKDIDFRNKSIYDKIKQVYKVNLENHADFQTLPEQDKATLSEEIDKLSQKLDSYGTVNLIAIEEYEELKKRYDFLTQQQNDLSQAKQSLHEVINKINRTTKQMFLDTFKKVQEEFHSYFRILFGGGDAQLFLIDESNPLESGIEIICRPPGKKLQNVLALSGGEKALAAVSLIFAIFKVKPAPFCILDEIDAALDEINISRFSTILQEFAKISQFLVITHNKRTIANADVMYGITMQEPGVSKLVSVKLSGVS